MKRFCEWGKVSRLGKVLWLGKISRQEKDLESFGIRLFRQWLSGKEKVMKKFLFVFLILFCACTAFSSALQAENAADAEKGTQTSEAKKFLAAIIVSDDHYRADVLFPELAPWLEENYGIETVVIHGHGGADFKNMERLKEADIALLYIRRIAPKTEQLELFKDFLKSGKPLMAFRTASHAFALSFNGSRKPEEGFSEWREFDAQVLGGNYHNHGPNDAGTNVRTLAAAIDHPIFKDIDLEPYHSNGSLYYTLPIDSEAVLFQTGTIFGRSEPLTWLRKNEWGGSVFYTALGHWDDFRDDHFRKMVGNAILYLCKEKELLQK